MFVIPRAPPAVPASSIPPLSSTGGLEVLRHQPVPDGPALHLAVLRAHRHRPHVQVPPPHTTHLLTPLSPCLVFVIWIYGLVYLFKFFKKLISRAGICFFFWSFFSLFYFVFLFDSILISLYFFFFLSVSVCVYVLFFSPLFLHARG